MPYGSSYGYGFMITPVVKKLLIINFVAFVAQMMLEVLHFDRYFMLSPHYFFRGCIWQPVTYMFMHGSFSHLFFNMLGLFFFGPSLEDHRGSSWFLKFYLFTGIGAGIIIVFFNLLFSSPLIPTLGASGAIFAILSAFAYYWPMRLIYIWGIVPVPAVVLIGLYAFIEITSIGSADGVSHIGHMAGLALALGLLLIEDHTNWLQQADRKYQGWRREQRRKKIKLYQPPPFDDDDEQEEIDMARNKQKMNAILEKVARNGIDSLTKGEREFLDAMSRRM